VTQPAMEEEKSLSATVHTAPPDISTQDVARLMTARGVGSVVIVEGRKPIGIVTDRDIVIRVTAHGLDPDKVPVESVMTSPLVTITQNEDVAVAIAVMARHGIRRLPIVDEAGCLAAILTLGDVLRLNLASPAELTAIVRERGLPHAFQPEGQTIPSSGPPSEPEGTAISPAEVLPEEPIPVLPHAAPVAPVPAGPVASIARPSAVVPMVKRRRRRASPGFVRRWMENNRS